MDDEIILKIAKQTSTYILNFHGGSSRYGGSWDPEDYEDCAQFCAMHIWQASQRLVEPTTGYLAGAGYKAARNWIASASQRNKSEIMYCESFEQGSLEESRAFHDGKPWENPLEAEDFTKIVELLHSTTNKRYKRAQTEKDAFILLCLSRGMTQLEIGNLLGISRWNVGMIRQRLRKRLERLLERI